MTPPTDAMLVARVHAGDATALALIVARYGPALMRFATHFLRSADEADDVLQEVFVRAETAIRRGAAPDHLDRWLFRITINRCRSQRRRWWRFVSGGGADQALATAAVRPDDESLALRDEIEAGLAALSAPLREAFLLKHVEGLDYQAMATITGVSVPALKMRVARAREQLRERLKEMR